VSAKKSIIAQGLRENSAKTMVFDPQKFFRPIYCSDFVFFRDALGLDYHWESKNPLPSALEFSHNRLCSDQVQISRVFGNISTTITVRTILKKAFDSSLKGEYFHIFKMFLR
jgi:hypothetical protein